MTRISNDDTISISILLQKHPDNITNSSDSFHVCYGPTAIHRIPQPEKSHHSCCLD